MSLQWLLINKNVVIEIFKERNINSKRNNYLYSSEYQRKNDGQAVPSILQFVDIYYTLFIIIHIFDIIITANIIIIIIIIITIII